MKKLTPLIVVLLLALIGYKQFQKAPETKVVKEKINIVEEVTTLKDVEKHIKNYEYEIALEKLKTLEEKENKLNEIYYLQSLIYLRTEKIKEFKLTFAKLKKENNNQEFLKELEFYYELLNNNYKEALSIATKSNMIKKNIFITVLQILQNDIQGAKKTLLENGTSINNKIIEQIALFETFQDVNISYLYTLIAKELKKAHEPILSKKLLLQAISIDSNFKDAWLYLGHLYLENTLYTQAQKSLEKARIIDPYEKETNFYLGINYYYLNQHTNAIKYLKNSINQDITQKAKAYEFLALAYYKNGDNKSALENFKISQQTITLNLSSYSTYIYLMSLENDTKGLNIALKKIQNKYPNQAMSYNLQGWIYLINKNYSLAKNKLNSALKLDPRLSAAYLNLGEIAIIEQKYDLAINYLDKAEMYSKIKNESGIYQKAKNLKKSL